MRRRFPRLWAAVALAASVACRSREANLIQAARLGSPDEVKRWLDRGADVDARDASGWTPLMRAAEAVSSVQLETVQVLLDGGADVNARSPRGETALMVAASHNLGEESPQILRALLEHGADPNAQSLPNTYLTSPLLEAVRGRSLTMVRILVEYRVDVNRDRAGALPLIQAIDSGYEGVDIAIFLVKKGADPSRADGIGDSALMHAIERRSDDVVQALLSAGANVHHANHDGVTVLMRAAVYGPPDLVETLLGEGVDVNLHDRWGNTALMWAVGSAHADVATFLLDRGADLQARDNSGRTALDIAVERRHSELVELLRKRGAAE